VAQLLALPGIGPYSAGAIASIAFGLPEPIVDGNVVRVLCRLFGLRGDPERAPLKAELWRLARELVPPDQPSEFNQGLMELGATLCTPSSPRCVECPLARHCVALSRGEQQELPELRKRRPATELRTAAALVARGSATLLRRLPDDSPRWAGLWVLPFVELAADEAPPAGALRALALLGIRAQALAQALALRHTITRFRIELSVVRCSLAPQSRLPSSAGFFTPADVEKLALPAVHARILRGLK
jgi:A/G-specific adenine glycosylase